MRQLIYLTITILLLAVLWLSADFGIHTPPPINYRLKWLFNASVAGDIYSDTHGFFAAHGLEVEVKEGGPERDAIKELEMGHAQFGVASADQVIRALAKDSPVVVIGQIFQTNPLQWIYRPDRLTINNPADLRGKRVGITHGGNDETIMRALLAKHGIAEQELQTFSVRYDYTPFYQGKVDLWPVYRNAQAIIIGEKLAQVGEKIAFFDPNAFGVSFVANSVVTTEAIWQEQRPMVEAFSEALQQGWQQALDPANVAITISTIQQRDPDTPAEIIAEQLSVTRDLVITPPDFRFGAIDVDAWQQTEKIMLEQGLITAPVHVEQHIKDLKFKR